MRKYSLYDLAQLQWNCTLDQWIKALQYAGYPLDEARIFAKNIVFKNGIIGVINEYCFRCDELTKLEKAIDTLLKPI